MQEKLTGPERMKSRESTSNASTNLQECGPDPHKAAKVDELFKKSKIVDKTLAKLEVSIETFNRKNMI